jgi:hypothetical protein
MVEKTWKELKSDMGESIDEKLQSCCCFLKITSSYFSNKSQWAIIVFFDYDKWIKSIFSTCSTIKGTTLRRNTICSLVHSIY